MTEVADLLEAPRLRAMLSRSGGAGGARQIAAVGVIEDLADFERAAQDSIVLLTGGASREADGYRFDMALHLAVSRRVGAVCLLAPAEARVSVTAMAIAERGDIALLRAEPTADLAELVVLVEQHLAAGGVAALRPARSALEQLPALEQAGATPAELVAALTDILGVHVEHREPGPDDLHAPVVVDGVLEGSLCAERTGRERDLAVELGLHLAAGAVARALSAERRAEWTPVQSQAEVLTEFLTAGHPRAGSLLERLRAMSVPVDGWHTVVRLEVDNLLETVSEDEVAAYELTRLLERQAHATARAEGGVWHRARADQALLLVSMEREDPGSRGSTTVARTAERVIARVRGSAPRLTVACGVGTAHTGPAGLRASAAEARSALGAARMARRENVPVCFDVIGLRRTVIEWYASDSAREAVDSVLAPLDSLGERRSTEAIHTLQVYLDQQGSLARTAEQLHLHRNAVRYRIRRIFELLDVDADEPDQRLILQLACRARSLRP